MTEQPTTIETQNSDLGWTVLPDGSVDFHGLVEAEPVEATDSHPANYFETYEDFLAVFEQ